MMTSGETPPLIATDGVVNVVVMTPIQRSDGSLRTFFLTGVRCPPTETPLLGEPLLAIGALVLRLSGRPLQDLAVGLVGSDVLEEIPLRVFDLGALDRGDAPTMAGFVSEVIRRAVQLGAELDPLDADFLLGVAEEVAFIFTTRATYAELEFEISRRHLDGEGSESEEGGESHE